MNRTTNLRTNLRTTNLRKPLNTSIIFMNDTQKSAFNQILVCLKSDIMFEYFLIYMGIDINSILKSQNDGQRGGANFNIMFLCVVSFMYSLIQVRAISINPSFITKFNQFSEANQDLRKIQEFVDTIDHTDSIINLEDLIPTEGIHNRNKIISKIVDTIDTLKILNNNRAFNFITLIKSIGKDVKNIIERTYVSSFQNNIYFFKNVCDLGLLSGTALNPNLSLILKTGTKSASYVNIFLSLKIIADINSDALREYASFTNNDKVELLNALYGGRSKIRRSKKRKNRRSKKKNHKSRTRNRM